MLATKDVEIKINFVWKFCRDKDRHEDELKAKKNLIAEYIKSHPQSNDITKVDLYPVERLGFGGSKVFYLDVGYIVGPSERCVAKFNSAEKTFREYKSALLAIRFSFCSEIYSSNKVDELEQGAGLLVYKFAKLPHGRAIEFREFYLNINNTDESCSMVLNKLYNDTIYFQPKDLASGEKVSFIKNYSWYIDRASAPLDKLRQLSDGLGPESDVSNKSEKLLSFYEALTKKSEYCDLEVKSIFQHGDLHARNILLDPENQNLLPDLIDFDWADFAHASRDFAVLETTLKYMLIQEFASDNFNGLDKHVPPSAYLKLEELLCEYGLDLPVANDELLSKYNIKGNIAILRAYECIRVIRLNAKRFLDVSFEGQNQRPLSVEKEYFLALFMISLGHMAFETSDYYWVLIGCDLLIAKIQVMC
jgi:hypothetical protein